jgi:DNA-binding MarR family transcriptional regulator
MHNWQEETGVLRCASRAQAGYEHESFLRFHMSKVNRPTSQTHDSNIGQRLHESLLLVQRRNRKAREAFDSPLSAVDSIALSIINGLDALTPSTLCIYLKLSPSRVSRLVATLIDRKLISTEQHSQDLRSKLLHFTPAGKRALKEVDLVNLRIMRLLSTELSSDEQGDIIDILTTLADEACPFTLPERTILSALKRLTAGLGMLSDSYADSGMPLSRFQILFDLWRKGGACSFKELADNFPLSSSSLSRECDSLVKLSLARKRPQISDRRGISLEITEDGSRLFLHHHRKIGERFVYAVRLLTPERIDRGLLALAKVTREAPLAAVDTASLECLACRDETALRAARAFLVEELVRAQAHLSLESELLPPTHECFVVKIDDVTHILTELSSSSKGPRQLRRIVCSPMVDASLLRRALKLVPILETLPLKSLTSCEVIPHSLREVVLERGAR